MHIWQVVGAVQVTTVRIERAVEPVLKCEVGNDKGDYRLL